MIKQQGAMFESVGDIRDIEADFCGMLRGFRKMYMKTLELTKEEANEAIADLARIALVILDEEMEKERES